MHDKLAQHFDLNLLVSLYTLIEFKNVTHAASALKMSQPALSVQLAKLRILFKDELLIPRPEGKGMYLTEKAELLHLPLKKLIDDLDTIQQIKPSFDASRDQRIFKIAISDTASVSIMTSLIHFLRQLENPQLQIEFVQFQSDSMIKQLEQNEVDLVIDLEANLPDHFPSLLLMDEDFVVCFSHHHPLNTRKEISIEDYCALQHIVVNTNEESLKGYTDHVLKSLGYTRFINHSVSNFLMAIECLDSTQFVCTLPRPMALSTRFGVSFHELPFPSPRFRLRMIWHPKNHSNSAIQWLRNEIFQIIRYNPK